MTTPPKLTGSRGRRIAWDIREWARKRDIYLHPRGRLPKAVVTAYWAEHPPPLAP